MIIYLSSILFLLYGTCFLAFKAKNLRAKVDELLVLNTQLAEEASNSMRIAQQEANKQCDALIKTRTAELNEEYQAKIVELRDKLGIDMAHTISQALLKDSKKTLTTEMKRITDKTFRRMSQEFVGEIEDHIDSLTKALEYAIIDRIWEKFQVYKEFHRDSPYVFPDGMKLAYTKGNRTVLIVEQKPQVRTVAFDGNLVPNSARKAAQGTIRVGSVQAYRFNLAFPYVYFVIVFDDGDYQWHEVYFRNKAITSIREHVYLSPLPNVFRQNDASKAKNCMGAKFQKKVDEEFTVARQSEVVISEFWQLVFNDDLGNGTFSRLDQRLKNFATWQENTHLDPLFILDIAWKNGCSLKSVVDKIINNRNRTEKLDQLDLEIRKLLTGSTHGIIEKIKDQIVKAKSLGFSAQDVDSVFAESLDQVLIQHTRHVFESCIKT